MSTHAQPSDIILIGAGLTGMAMACALGKQGLSVTVIEAGDCRQLQAKESDGRTCAISYGSSLIFQELGLWEMLEGKGGPIWDIRVTDGNSPLFVHYDHQDVGENPMGYIIENVHLREALFTYVARLPCVTLRDNTRYREISRKNSSVTVTLEDGTALTAALLIGADGRHSRVRTLAGITTTEWDYKQTGIVCTVEHAQPHQGVAVEKFLPAGPFAILPMHHPHRSSLVWTEPTSLAPLYMAMSDEEFVEQLERRFHGYLGALKLIGPRFSYPLSLCLARQYTAPRLALIGDAAHAMHPIAGQGFNLGIRDIPPLLQAITEAKYLGLDIGSDTVLAEYAARRKFDNITLLAVTDALTRLFSNNNTPLKHARRLGLAAVNALPPVKKFFIRHAMGTFGQQ